ncbi:MAG: hypothetical protein ACLFSV_06875 [Alkalispirochaeta sp.]
MATFVIPTCDRPETLRRSLRSVLSALIPESGIRRVLVIDDARTEAGADAARRVVEEVSGNEGVRPLGKGSDLGVGLAPSDEAGTVPVGYIGRREKEILVQELAGACNGGVPESVIRFALLGDETIAVDRGSGGSRNTALLLSAGDAVVSLDDDARFEFLSLRGTSLPSRTNPGKPIETVSQRSFSEEYVQGPVESLRSIERLAIPVDLDVAGWIVRTLGGPGVGTPGNAPRVRAVMTGIAGNRWYQRPEPAFFSRGKLREQVMRREGRYRRALTSGYATMQAQRYVATDAPFFVTCCSGVDARDFLPPFPPDLRPDDTAFMSLLRRLDPGGMTGHLPVMARHDLGPQRPDPIRDPCEEKWSLSSVVTGIMSEVVSRGVPLRGDAGVSAVGRRLAEIAALPTPEWLDYIYTVWTRTVASAAAGLEHLLQRNHESPSFWEKDVHEFVARLRVCPPPASASGSTGSEETERLQRYVGALGELLEWWPALWQAARERNGIADLSLNPAGASR